MSEVWFYVEEGERRGPLEEDKFLELIKTGVLGEEDYVWRKGFDDWLQVSEIDELKKVLMIVDQDSEDITDNSAMSDNPDKIPVVQDGFDWGSIDYDEKKFCIYIGKDRGTSGGQYGPYSLKLIKKLFLEKRINEKTYIWSKGMENWMFLGEIPIYNKLFDATPPEISEQDKRQNVRKPFVARILFHDNKELFEGVCRDISIGGMQVMISKFPSKVGEKISMNVHPENTDYHFTASGMIVRLLKGDQGFSFRFTDLSDDAHKSIEDYVKSENMEIGG